MIHKIVHVFANTQKSVEWLIFNIFYYAKTDQRQNGKTRTHGYIRVNWKKYFTCCSYY